MDIQVLKEYILEQNAIPIILESLGCGHIKYHNGSDDPYYTCSNPDGNNQSAISVYKCENLTTINYTREISKNNKSSDIFTLIEFVKEINFFESLKYVCNLLGIDYYQGPNLDVPPSVTYLKMLKEMNKGITEEDDTPIKPIDPIILTYYKKCGNMLWFNDNVDFTTQYEFEMGYDACTNRITIPIRDEVGTLCGVKGRLYKDVIEDYELKFLYIEPCPRNKILYGYNKTKDEIKKAGKIFCLESEKGVHQLWSYGYKNSIAFGGKKVSHNQIQKLERLNVEIILAFDKDVLKDEIEKITEQFIDGIPIYYIWDSDNILGKKEAPCDNPEKWKKLVENNVYKIR